jgi:hypothetical protein
MGTKDLRCLHHAQFIYREPDRFLGAPPLVTKQSQPAGGSARGVSCGRFEKAGKFCLRVQVLT